MYSPLEEAGFEPSVPLYTLTVSDPLNRNRVFRFARDSPLEGDGFEPSVPRVMEVDLGRQVPALIAVFELAGTAVTSQRGTKFAFSMLEAAQLESANSRTVVRGWQSWETGFSRWQARQVRSPWQSKYRTDL